MLLVLNTLIFKLIQQQNLCGSQCIVDLISKILPLLKFIRNKKLLNITFSTTFQDMLEQILSLWFKPVSQLNLKSFGLIKKYKFHFHLKLVEL